MLKIEFDASNKPLAYAIGTALRNYADAQLDPSSAAILSQVKANETDPKLDESDASASSSQAVESESNTKTLAETQSETTHGETQSTADTADNDEGDYEFEQYWRSASGLDYAGHPIHETLGVPVDDKGYPIIDTYGVKHNPDMCGKAAKPFYGSGPQKGKWKAKVGVDKDEYANWHAAQLAESGKPDTAETTDGPTQSNGSAAADAFKPAQDAAPEGSPADNFGTLMGWIAAKQTAETLKSDQINEAYVACGTSVAEMMRPDSLAARQTVLATLKALAGEA